MESMVERVAKAIESCPALVQIIEGSPDPAWVYKEACRQAARAAIEAMRGPTERMTYAGSWAVGPGGDRAKKAELAKAWGAMIDAALSHPEGE
jgi:hypothetical protein